MKKKRILIIAFAFSAALSMIFAGCSTNTSGSPQDVIKDAYGNRQFRISFNSEGLDSPIADITYSADSMPALPTPERVGYIFSGWYMNSSYTTPYTDGILYLYMCDVTLYAKWERETFETNGTYDIEFSASITDISYKGELVDKYGYYDLSEYISEEDTYIEKTEDGLLLKLQYEAPTDVPFGSSDVFTVTVASQSASTVVMSEEITPDNDREKTLFFNIDNHNLTEPIYFTVSALNYESGLSTTEISKTQVIYTLEFNFDRLIGFSRPFTDASVQLASNTYYLIKTHYVPDDYDGESMLESYNAVYSYLKVDGDGNYSLIKQFTPYTGLVSAYGTVSENFTENFYSRWMTFGPTKLYYSIDPPDDLTAAEIANAEYLPELYNGGYYGSYTVEYHSDSGKYYMIYDIGKDLTKQFVVNGATTGFMEVMMGMGSYNVIMTIDYDHIVQLSSIDYTPLSGDSYDYGEPMQYYAGDLADLNDTDMSKGASEELGLSTEMINYYYTSSSSGKKMYSHSYTVTPNSSTNAYTVADSRYRIARFDTTTKIYGYNPQTDGTLCADSMTVNTFGGNALRELSLNKINGKSLEIGERVWFSGLYAEKVNANGDFSDVSVTVYDLNADGGINYASKTLPDTLSAYTFTKNVAVEFIAKTSAGTAYSLVYLKEASEPAYTVGGVYTNGEYMTGTEAVLPDIAYTWGSVSGKFIDNYYESADGETGVNPVRVAYYDVQNGAYRLNYFSPNTFALTIGTSTDIVVAYELKNEFGERYYIYLPFTSIGGNQYEVTKDGETVASGIIKYAEDGERRAVSASARYAEAYTDVSDVLAMAEVEYKINLDGTVYNMPLIRAVVYTSAGVTTLTGNFEAEITQLLSVGGYGIVVFTFGNGTDSYECSCAYNFSYGGKDSLRIFTDEYLFTNYTYTFNVPEILSPDGVSFGAGELRVRTADGWNASSNQASISSSDGQYTLTFHQTGVYYITLITSLSYDENGDRIFGGSTYSLWITQEVVVKDGRGDVEITFITDSGHPFKEGIVYEEITVNEETAYVYTVSASLTQDIFTLSKTGYFASSSDVLFGWSPRVWGEYTLDDASRIYDSGTMMSDYIGSFGTDKITLYAIWDSGLKVHMDMNTDITLQNNYDMTTIYATSTGTYRGYYSVSLPAASAVRQPTGYIFVGWTLKETGMLYSAGSAVRLSEREIFDGEITFEATFIQEFKVRYQINSTCGNTVLDGTVAEGKLLTQPAVTAKQGYTFKEWRIATTVENGKATEISDNAFDFSSPASKDTVNAVITNRDSIVLVAVFTDAEGNEVW